MSCILRKHDFKHTLLVDFLSLMSRAMLYILYYFQCISIFEENKKIIDVNILCEWKVYAL